jgi:LPS sulfotransferase NodH
VDKIASALGARDLDIYVDLIQRHRCVVGTWGAKVTPEHALHVFGGIPKMMERFYGANLAWLIREDVVAQAVSRYMKALTKVAHLTNKIEREDLSHIPYDNHAIWVRIEKIIAAEREAEAQFAALGLAPIRLSYERNMAAAPEVLLARLGELVGLPPRSQEVKSRHRKLGAQKNAEFIAMFKERNSDALEKVAQERASMLAAIDQQA